VKYVIVGLSITSSWGNGHATTFRSLVKELVTRGHDVLFLERDVPWYADNRDMPEPPYGRTCLYQSVAELKRLYADAVREADAVIVGSYVPDGIEVSQWVTRTAHGVTAFYDIDTPITLAGLQSEGTSYIDRETVPRFDLYLSFTGGPTLERLEREFGARRARPLYCSVDPSLYYPEPVESRWMLGYLGTYSSDRQPTVERLLLAPAAELPAQRFIVAGAQYPKEIDWPPNVEHVVHIAPADHRAFYAAQRYTLNVTRAEMIRAGWSPSVRLFEAAACGTPIISDAWPGLESVLVPGREVLIARSTQEMISYLRDLSDGERQAIARAARDRILREHTAAHRAAELDGYVSELYDSRSARSSRPLRSGLSKEAGGSAL
jgi:spore maturation protein CgeB